ncbi:MAG: ATP-binding protein [Tuberibacillus sp.]
MKNDRIETKSPQTTSEQKKEMHLSQLASVGQIAAGIAHEVRNPLTAVKGFLQLLSKEKPDTYIDIALTELDNALTTLENLLQVSKPDLEDEPLIPFNIVAEVESILNLFIDQRYRVQVEKKYADTNAIVFGRKNQFKKALFNLLKNAHEAIQGEGYIYIEEKSYNGRITLSIKDTGVGIPKEKLSLLGTPFFTTKEKGTGMGLTQVFSAIYQHGGTIKVESEEGKGTRFLIDIPIEKTEEKGGVRELDLVYKENQSIREFFLENNSEFAEQLLSESINVRDVIDEIHRIGNIDLLKNAHKLVLFVVDGEQHKLMMFAKEEGIAWAKHSLTISFKLEWLQSIRRVLWTFIYNYFRLSNVKLSEEMKEFFECEKRYNDLLDQFLSNFFISYTQYKDQLLQSQKELIQDLTLPMIPLTSTMSILPLIGAMDSIRIDNIREEIFDQINNMKIKTLIIDLSGVVSMDPPVLSYFLKILDGLNMMGCNPVITGTRPEMVNSMINLGVSFKDRAEIKGTLQQALEFYIKNEK